ncbi:protein D3-like [Phlebotomus argentipes]|uniref:protein D3-like n=1 Tax=Phlebotomus argentipes TaxID=94469 RepID=UPI002892B489|nr:protein D3-like [Phlebotomus argentipes]
MSLKAFFVIFALAISVNSASKLDVASKFKDFEVVPDVLDTAPENPIEIKYPSGVEVNYGNELTPTDVKDIPYVTWSANSEDYYTLILTDPDAPSRAEPRFREFKHWVVVNIPGKSVSEGETIAEYIGSGPPKGTGLHRYVFLVYKQPSGKVDFSAEEKTSNRSRAGRPSFSAKKFAAKYSLQLLAGNFYQAQYDDYVPILHAQLSE